MLLSQVLDQILMIQPQKSALGTLLLAIPYNKSACCFIPEVTAIGPSPEFPEWSTLLWPTVPLSIPNHMPWLPHSYHQD